MKHSRPQGNQTLPRTGLFLYLFTLDTIDPITKRRAVTDWTIETARDAYNLPHWGGGYFDINANGHLCARPDRNPAHPGIDLHQLADELRQSGLNLPVLVRFNHILHDRVDTLCNAFADAIADHDYHGQLHRRLSDQGQPAAQRGRTDRRPRRRTRRARSRQQAGTDGGVGPVRTRRRGGLQRLQGPRVHPPGADRPQAGPPRLIVVEKLSELELVLREAHDAGRRAATRRAGAAGLDRRRQVAEHRRRQIQIRPVGRQALTVVERLRDAGHWKRCTCCTSISGSQIANIHDIQRGLRECARYYRRPAAPRRRPALVDVGGGLGVDYEGTRSRSDCSMNYSVQEYANNVVHVLAEACAAQSLPHPASSPNPAARMTAHHAVLITNIIDIERHPQEDEVSAPRRARPGDPARPLDAA